MIKSLDGYSSCSGFEMHRCIKKLDVSRCKITDAAKLLKQSSVTSLLKQMAQRDRCMSDKQKTFIIKINLTNLNRMSNGAKKWNKCKQ